MAKGRSSTPGWTGAGFDVDGRTWTEIAGIYSHRRDIALVNLHAWGGMQVDGC